MNLRDIARERTVGLRDSLSSVERRREGLAGERQAEQERIKRLFSELAAYRKDEQALKRQVSDAETGIAAVRAEIDELERRRTELFEKYTALTESRRSVETDAKAVQQQEKQVNEAVQRAQDSLRSLERDTGGLEEELAAHSSALRRAYAEAFAEYCGRLKGRIEGALGGQTEQARRLERKKQFLAARHTDAEIGQLCDERDELRAILDSSRVPGVRALLTTRLGAIEARLEELFPGAHSTEVADTSEGFSAELFYLREDDDEFILFLPFEERLWKEMEAEVLDTPGCDVAAAVLYGTVKTLRLKPSDGEFRLRGGRIAFVGRLDETDVAVLASSPLSLPNLPDVYLNLSRMPSEIEEALKSDAIRS